MFYSRILDGRFLRAILFGVLPVLGCMLIASAVSASMVSQELRDKLVKVDGSPALYYVDSEGMRHLFTSESIFWTYYTGTWNKLVDKTEEKKPAKIITITQDQFDQLPLGINMLSGSNSIIRFNNSATVYKTSYIPNVLCEIPASISASDKAKLSKLAVIIPSSFASDYEYVYSNTAWCNEYTVSGKTVAEITKRDTSNPSPADIIRDNMLAEKSRKLASGKEAHAMGYEGALLLKEYAHAIKDKDWDAVNAFRVNPIEEDALKDKKIQEVLKAYADAILEIDPSEYITVNRDLYNLVISTDVYSSQVEEDGVHAIAGVKYSVTFKIDNGALKIGEFRIWPRTSLIANMSQSEATEYIKKQLIDDDGDGLITAFENCEGVYAQANICSKTYAYTRDSDGDGYWDGLLDYDNLVK